MFGPLSLWERVREPSHDGRRFRASVHRPHGLAIGLPPPRNPHPAFGPNRLIDGGGWGDGSTGGTYRASVERARTFLADMSAADQAKVLDGNAAKLFGFA